MSHFYAEIVGNKGSATRQGTQTSGMIGHIRGWNIGVRVEISYEDGIDICRVYKTGGTNNPQSILIAEVREQTGGQDLSKSQKTYNS